MTLRPCPFCGSDNTVVGILTGEPDHPIRWGTQCSSCKAASPEGVSREQVETLWNTRPGERAAAEKMREECKQVFQTNIDGWNEMIGGLPTGTDDSQAYSLQKSIEEAQEWIDEIDEIDIDRVLEDQQ